MEKIAWQTILSNCNIRYFICCSVFCDVFWGCLKCIRTVFWIYFVRLVSIFVVLLLGCFVCWHNVFAVTLVFKIVRNVTKYRQQLPKSLR